MKVTICTIDTRGGTGNDKQQSNKAKKTNSASTAVGHITLCIDTAEGIGKSKSYHILLMEVKQPMKYLVTGATGAIGSGVVRQLAVEGKEIRAFVRDADKFHRLLPDVPAGVVTGDVLNPADVRRAVAGVVRKDTSFPAPVDVPHQFVYVDDAARALIAVAGRDKCYGKRYTVGDIQPVTVRCFAEMIYQEAGTRGRVRGMPFWLLRLLGLFSAEARAGAGMMHTFAWDISMDGTAIRRDADFAPQVGYEEGVRCTLAWFRAT